MSSWPDITTPALGQEDDSNLVGRDVLFGVPGLLGFLVFFKRRLGVVLFIGLGTFGLLAGKFSIFRRYFANRSVFMDTGAASGAVVGAVLAAVYNTMGFSMPLWMPLAWAFVQVVFVIIASFSEIGLNAL
ncbi:hypothetical protein HK101_007069 [Irineochytrium annulatum]|nr:hypothetical protein HK101_007069 [Irineochytrium annulatum]